MKKSVIFIVALMAILIFCLSGCNTNKTEEIWAKSENKEATDVITITKFNIMNFLVVQNAKITIDRKFEKGITTVDLTLNELNIQVKSKMVISILIDKLRGELGIDFSYKDFEGIINNFKYLKCNLVLSENNTKLKYAVDLKIDYLPELYSKELSGSVILDLDSDYGNALSQALDLLTSHFSTVFVPNKDGTAEVNTTKLNALLKALVAYAESVDPNKDSENYVPITNKLNKILGLTHYTQLLSSKIKIKESASEYTLNKKFMNSMDVSFTKIQFMYNKSQTIALLKRLVNELDPSSADQIDQIGLVLTEITAGESCVEIGKINIHSNYNLNK